MADKYPTFASPVGKLSFPNLNEPRDFQGDGKFKYDAQLHLAEADKGVSEFLQKVDGFLEESLKEHKTTATDGPPYQQATEKDRETDEVSEIPGVQAVKFSVPAVTKTRKGPWDRKPKFFDSKGVVCEIEPQIGAGTEGRFFYQVYNWKMGKRAGVTLQPVGFQITKLVKGGGGGGLGNSVDAIGGDFDGSTVEAADFGDDGVPPVGESATGGDEF